jgi:hypothetical protein
MFQASSLPIIRSSLLYIQHWLIFMQVLMTASKQSSILTWLGSGHQNQHETYQCRMYSRELLMMGKEDA